MRFVIFALMAAGLAGCEGWEMPLAPEGADEMRKSPCACAQIPFENKGFESV